MAMAMAALQEATFACFEDEERGDAPGVFPHSQAQSLPAGSPPTAASLPTHDVPLPPNCPRRPGSHSGARLRALECTGSGTFYFQHDALRHRFLCWRVTNNIVVVREWSLHESLRGNGVRLSLPAHAVPTGVAACEAAWTAAQHPQHAVVVLSVLTYAGTIHRFTFALPVTSTAVKGQSILTRDESGGARASPASATNRSEHHGVSSVFPRSPAFRVATDCISSLREEEVITTALWVNEYNVIVATSSGRILGVNFGLPASAMTLSMPMSNSSMTTQALPQEFEFSDESMMSWLWHGLVPARHRQRVAATLATASMAPSGVIASSDDVLYLAREAIVAMTFFPLSTTEMEDDDPDSGRDIGADEIDDVCILTLSADFTLRAWSFRTQVCLGKQSLRAHLRRTRDGVSTTSNGVARANEENADDDDDDDMDSDDVRSGEASETLATHAKLMAIPSSSSGGNCRLLVHVDATDTYAQQIVLLRGDLVRDEESESLSSGLSLDVGRVFTVGEGKRLKFVDFAVEKGFLYSAWRSASGDFVYAHANPMARTGPRVIPGQLVSSIDVQMKRYESEDNELPMHLLRASSDGQEDAGREGTINTGSSAHILIDNFFVERILIPGRFSRQTLYRAIAEYHGDLNVPLRAYFTQSGPQESRYQELLVHVVSEKSLQTAGRFPQRRTQTLLAPASCSPNIVARIAIWKEIISVCNKHWRSEVAPIGFATAPTGSLFLGSPVLLRRNRISLFFPSASTIASTLLISTTVSLQTVPSASGAASPSRTVAGRRESVREIVSEVLPVFDGFPSHSFQSAIQRDVAAVLPSPSDWKADSLAALARQAVRLVMQPAQLTGANAPAELLLTRVLLRLGRILGGDASLHEEILQDLVNGLMVPSDSSGFKSDDEEPESFPTVWQQQQHQDNNRRGETTEFSEEDGDADMDTANGHRQGPSNVSPLHAYFHGKEMSFALSQVTARSVDELCKQALRIVLLLSYLVDVQPTFITSKTLKTVERNLLPKAIVVYQRWSLTRWLSHQNMNSTNDVDNMNAGTLLPPLLQCFLDTTEANTQLNNGERFQRLRAIAEMRDEFDFDPSQIDTNGLDTEHPHALLAGFAGAVLSLVSRPNIHLVAFLQRKKQFRMLRSMLRCSLNEQALGLRQSSRSPLENEMSADDAILHGVSSRVTRSYLRAIAECLAWEGHELATRHDESNRGGMYADAMSNHDQPTLANAASSARWCFQQSARCLNVCLSSLCAQIEATQSDASIVACERFVRAAVRLLQETVPRGSHDAADVTLRFLWVLASEALPILASVSLQCSVWVNIFKYSVEQRAYRDAHLALMRTLQLSAIVAPDQNMTDEENDGDYSRTVIECTSYFVTELCRHRRMDLVCDLQWGALEVQVEDQIDWLAANAGVLKEADGDHCGVQGVDPTVIMYHELGFAFCLRRNQPANAAAAMHALYLRLRLATSTTAVPTTNSSLATLAVLQVQRNALLVAMNVLLQLTEENRWVVRKAHAEELLANPLRRPSAQQVAALHIVTYQDMARDLAVLEGKLRLVKLEEARDRIGRDNQGKDRSRERVLLASAMDASAVVALLVESTMALVCSTGNTGNEVWCTASEKQRESVISLELAVQIIKTSELGFSNTTRSIARACVASVERSLNGSPGMDSVAWQLLQTYLLDGDDLAQYEVAAEAILAASSHSSQQKLALPAWLTERVSCSKRGDAACLVRLYVQHGLLVEATRTASAMIPMALLEEGEAAFRQRAGAVGHKSGTSSDLPFLPYTLFDSVLNASDVALEQHQKQAASYSHKSGATAAAMTAAAATLRAATQTLRDRLLSYFRYVHALEQAREAANASASARATTFASWSI